MSQQGRRRMGFTLIELLVVIAIIAILIGLLLPAIQKVREAANRAKCQSNLKEIAIAIHNYQNAAGYLPTSTPKPGTTTLDATEPNWSWMAYILPYVEQGPIADLGNIPVNAMNVPATQTAMAMQIPVFLCPTDPFSNSGPRTDEFNITGIPVGQTNYQGCSGSNWGYDAGRNPGVVSTSTSFAADARWYNAGPTNNYDGLDAGDGIFYRTNWFRKITLSSITDGTSNTFMVGEQLPAMNQHCDWPYFNHAQATCGIGPNAVQTSGKPYAPSDWPDVFGFRSLHKGGINFAFADGSVRFVSDGIDLSLYRALATIAGGEAVEPP